MMRWLCLCGCLSAAFAQQPGEIRGQVLDALGGEPLGNVRVQLVATEFRTITDAQGGFQIRGIPPGDYELQVTTVGYRLARKPFTIGAREVKDFEIALSPETFRHTETVEVTAGPFEAVRAESPSERTLAAGEAKNLASVLADDPLRAVHGLPGVASNDDFNSRFSLRGADYHRLGLYLDDILLHAPFHMVAGEPASGSITAFQGDMLEGLSLYPGASPARYADRTAGALDVRTREGSRLAPSLRLTASASNTGFVAEGPIDRSRRGSWLAGARKSYLQYIIDRTTDDDTLGFGFLDGQFKLAYDLTPRHSVSLNLVDGSSDGSRRKARNTLGPNSVMLSEYHLTLASAAWQYAPSERLLLTSRAAYMRERFENLNRDRMKLAGGYYGEWIWSGSASWTQSPAMSLEAGWSLRRLREDGSYNRYQFNPFAILLLDDFRGSALHPGLYLEQSWSTPGGRLRLSAGGRWDRHDLSGIQAVSPHAGAAVELGRGAHLLLGWGQYVQFPDLQWMLLKIGSRNLAPERANHFVAAIEQRFGERTRLRAEYYDRADRDLLFRPLYEPRLIEGAMFHPPLDPPVLNALRGYARGFEIFLQRRTANRLTGWISYSYGRTRLRDGVTGAEFPADQDQRHTVNSYGSYRIRPTANLSLKWIYGSGFPVPGFYRLQDGLYYLAEQRNRVRLDAYQRVDLRINKVFTFDRWRMTLYGEVVNLFNRDNYRYDSFGGYDPQTGRARPRFDKMFPILPSAGIVLEFEGRR